MKYIIIIFILLTSCKEIENDEEKGRILTQDSTTDTEDVRQ